MDYNEAVIPNAYITIQGEGIKQEVFSDEEGKYQVKLPVGIYEIAARANLFRPFRRAPFRVQPNTTTVINIVPVPTATDVNNPPIYYDSFLVSNPSGTPLTLLIQSGWKSRYGEDNDYRNVTATYDTLTIYASRLRFNPKTLQIGASDGVIIEEGAKRTYANQARISLMGGKPVFEVIQ